MADVTGVSIRVATRLKKYAPGDDPATAEPVEVLQTEETLTGDEARRFLNRLQNNTIMRKKGD